MISAFIIYHIHALHLHKSLHFHTYSFSMFFVQTITYILLSSFTCYVHSCMVLSYSCSCLAFSSASPQSHNEARKLTLHSWLCVLGTMVITINKPCRGYTLFFLENDKKRRSHVHMVPNASNSKK